MPPLSLLIKPASSACNLNCSYCFYADVSSQRQVKNYGMMKEETAEAIIRRAFEYADTVVTFAFQGGEPTLIGLSFYQFFTDKVREYNIKKIKVNYALQTNGMLIDDDFAAFFAEEKFLLGISLDGPKEIHDLNRKNKGGQGSYTTIMNGIKVLQKYKVDFNILTVINKAVARHPQKIYEFFKSQGFDFMQFIPCIDNFGETRGTAAYALTPLQYGDFLCRIFDLYERDIKTTQPTSIRMFDNLVQMAMGYPPESCDMMGRCSVNTVVEADGAIYPCDFYVLDKWRLGNLMETPLETLLTSEKAKTFAQMSFEVNDQCKTCQYVQLCRGGCRRHREVEGIDGLGLNYYCAAYQQFYAYAYPKLKMIVKLLSNR